MIILNSQKRSKDRPSLKYSSGGSGPLWRYDGPAFSLPTTGGGGRSMTKKHNWDSYPVEGRIRRLLPVECERLMSWPDGHTAKGRKEDGTEYEVSDTQRYKMCGNGVVSEVVHHIIQELYVQR